MPQLTCNVKCSVGRLAKMTKLTKKTKMIPSFYTKEIPLITGQTPKATALKTKPLGQYTLPGIMIHACINVADPELFT